MTDLKRVTGIGGVFLRTNNPAQLAQWYAETLGIPLENVEPDAEQGGSVSGVFTWRDSDDPKEVGMTVWALFPRDTTYLGDGQVMVNYRVKDLDAILADLESASVWIDPKREESAYGKFGWIKDPEGNRIELWQPPE